jgi:hypothetical protein
MAKIDDIETRVRHRFTEASRNIRNADNEEKVQEELNRLECLVLDDVHITYITAIKIALNTGTTVGGHK